MKLRLIALKPEAYKPYQFMNPTSLRTLPVHEPYQLQFFLVNASVRTPPS